VASEKNKVTEEEEYADGDFEEEIVEDLQS